MAHFNPDSKNRVPFRIIEEDKSFKSRVVVPSIQIFLIFIVLRIGMLAFGMPFFWIPGLDPLLSAGVAKVEAYTKQFKE